MATPELSRYANFRPNRCLGATVRVFIDWAVALFERDPHLIIENDSRDASLRPDGWAPLARPSTRIKQR